MLWLPPGWAQAWKQDAKGFRRKLFVAPEAFGRKAVYNKSQVQEMTGSALVPVDQNGDPLPQHFPDHWPNWLPHDWQVGFASQESERCFRNAMGDVFSCEEEAKRHLRDLDIFAKAKVAPAEVAAIPIRPKGPLQTGKARRRKVKPEPKKVWKRLRKLAPEKIAAIPDSTGIWLCSDLLTSFYNMSCIPFDSRCCRTRCL